ncbi:chromosome partitioning protein, ParB family [Pseudobutyrivibrio sp. YE44]|uniref:ParB/RepB/Spo0J family partition protein n=1 Tax=Pseudobutyrivibrio sp. YE44 TaxID=1520802 RepID=UPI00088A6220|nr:ParB/RepB/Spo0J family partition protein [Pseudobutyrivibrio sp. YE44]SDB44696.1 chromosome partitioning protein, ParB family [Pseudobutyrivibrio sp. YE44]
MAAKREKIHFASVEELLGAPTSTGEGTVELRVEDIYPFENHPFKVIDDDKMEDLIQSIKENGVLTPVIVRPDDEGTYEMISGHRRLYAAKRAGLLVIPAIIKPMTNDDAVIAMVDANVQREEILPSERAWSLKMKLDAMKRQGYRSDLSSAQNERRLETADIVGEEMGISRAQVRRFIRLTELIPELMELVDKKRLTFTMAVDISYFDRQLQQWVYEYITENGFIKPEQIAALKACDNLENMAQPVLISTLKEALKPKKKSQGVTLSERKLNKYFSNKTSAADRERIIINLLEKWKHEQEV